MKIAQSWNSLFRYPKQKYFFHYITLHFLKLLIKLDSRYNWIELNVTDLLNNSQKNSKVITLFIFVSQCNVVMDVKGANLISNSSLTFSQPRETSKYFSNYLRIWNWLKARTSIIISRVLRRDGFLSLWCFSTGIRVHFRASRRGLMNIMSSWFHTLDCETPWRCNAARN